MVQPLGGLRVPLAHLADFSPPVEGLRAITALSLAESAQPASTNPVADTGKREVCVL